MKNTILNDTENIEREMVNSFLGEPHNTSDASKTIEDIFPEGATDIERMRLHILNFLQVTDYQIVE